MDSADTSPGAYVSSYKNVVYVSLQGIWTVQADLAYLTNLSNHIGKMNRNQWGMIVDMRNWTLPLEVFESPFKSKVVLDRRNQIAEAWIVNNVNQGDLLLGFFKHAPTQPKRFFDLQGGIDYLQAKGLQAAPQHLY